MKATNVSQNRLHCWYLSGVIRTVPAIRQHGKGYALVDIVRVKLMTPAQRREAGIILTPDAYRKCNVEWHENQQSLTRGGSAHYEQWDEYDNEFLLEELERGTTVTVIARALGRTYHAVENQIYRLRNEMGELPPVERKQDEGWQERALELLTPEEAASLLTS